MQLISSGRKKLNDNGAVKLYWDHNFPVITLLQEGLVYNLIDSQLYCKNKVKIITWSPIYENDMRT